MLFRFLSSCAVGQGAEESRRRYVDEPETDFHKMTAEMLGAEIGRASCRERVSKQV